MILLNIVLSTLVYHSSAGYITIDAVGDEKFAIRDDCNQVLAKNLRWEYEPLNSARTEEFLTRTRYDSFDEAEAKVVEWLESIAEGGVL